jgi:hypothetical protein
VKAESYELFPTMGMNASIISIRGQRASVAATNEENLIPLGVLARNARCLLPGVNTR